ncbi:MAG: signal recognition particle-docking protein FtsY [Spirochaetia bacterium]|jgi:fused signal recognition particle receptor
MMLQGLGKRLHEIFQGREYDGEFFSDLEDALIEADMGARFSAEIIQGLRESARKDGIRSREGVREALKTVLRQHIVHGEIEIVPGALNILLVLGVNGVGKTTTIAKLARYFSSKRGMDRILLVAGDTFRAAAIDQLRILADRLGLPVVAQEPGADPGAVIFDGISSAVARGIPLVIADTAGRLHTRDALVKELAKIDKIVTSRAVGATYRKVLVLDATTGQNSLAQAEVFHRSVGIDSIVLTKIDSTAKGGMVVPICRDLGIPISFLGDGEKLDDLEVFDPDAYLSALIGES